MNFSSELMGQNGTDGQIDRETETDRWTALFQHMALYRQPYNKPNSVKQHAYS